MGVTIQMRGKGGITIPAELRKRYEIDEGDVFTLVDLGDGSFLLTPRMSLVPKLVAEMARMRREAGITMEEMLQGVAEERERYYLERLAEEDEQG